MSLHASHTTIRPCIAPPTSRPRLAPSLCQPHGHRGGQRCLLPHPPYPTPPGASSWALTTRRSTSPLAWTRLSMCPVTLSSSGLHTAMRVHFPPVVGRLGPQYLTPAPQSTSRCLNAVRALWVLDKWIKKIIKTLSLIHGERASRRKGPGPGKLAL